MESGRLVLSDLRTNVSYIYYGSFSRMLGIDKCGDEGKVSSIWEKEIFKLIHPDVWLGSIYKNCIFFHFTNVSPRGNAPIII